MLQKLHEKTKGWVASVIIGLLCLAFALWGVQYYVSGGDASGQLLAKIGDKKITVAEIDNVYRQLQRQATERGINLDNAANAQLKAQALNQLMLQTLLVESAKKDGFVVTKAQAEQLIMSLPAFQQNGQFSPQLFQQTLFNAGLTEQSYFQELQAQLLISQVANSIQGTTFVLPDEVENFYDLIMQKRNVGYALVSAQRFIAEIKLTPAEIQNYYDNNKEKFRAAEQVSIQYLELSPTTLAQSIKLNPAEVKQYYQDHLSNYGAPANWKLEMVTVPLLATASAAEINATREKIQKMLVALKNNTSFATFMQQYHGETKTLSQNELTEDLQKALQSLKPGQTSQPIHTNHGYVILHVLAYTPAKTKSFAEVENSIQRMLTQQKVERVLAEKNEKLSNLTFTSPDTLEPAAKALGVPIQVSELFSVAGAASGIAANPAVVKVAFSKEVLEQGNNSNPVTLKNGDVIVLRVQKHIPSKILSLAEVNSKVRTELLGKTADAKAALLANQIETEINRGANPAAVAAKYHLSWIIKNDIQRDNKQLTSELLTAVFDRSVSELNKAVTASAAKGDTAVLVVTKITSPNFKTASQKEKQQFTRDLTGLFAQLTYRLYILNAKSTIKEKIYEQNFKSLQE